MNALEFTEVYYEGSQFNTYGVAKVTVAMKGEEAKYAERYISTAENSHSATVVHHWQHSTFCIWFQSRS